MLRSLRIREFALIRELEIEFGPGLNLLTGETGSGKSIIVDALGLLLGDRPSQEMIRTGSESAIIEGVFTPERMDSTRALLDDSGIDSADDGLILRREISVTGRNRIFINNGPATLGLLKSIGASLADIHGQHDRQALLELPTHLHWLDRFGGNEEAVRGVRERHRDLRATADELESMRMDEQERLRRIDMLEYQLNEIARADPQPHEWEALRSERSVLAHSEKVFALASEAYSTLYESDTAVMSRLSRLNRLVQELGAFDPAWNGHREALQDSLYRLQDLAVFTRDYTSGFDFSAARMEQVERRLSELERLVQNYGPGMENVLAYREKCGQELEALRSHGDSVRDIEARLERELQAYGKLAEALSDRRRKDAARLECSIRSEFRALAMEKMELKVQFHPREPESRQNAIPGHYGPSGIDRVEFMAAPNIGEEQKPLARIASGGELSRVMLAIRSTCQAGEEGRSLVFDEVDAGIGGRVAEAVGRRLQSIARVNQVLCVTHLAQIAAFADCHFRVTKSAGRSRTETRVERLDEEDRVVELARMLGGETVTPKAQDHAREMLYHSRGEPKPAAGK